MCRTHSRRTTVDRNRVTSDFGLTLRMVASVAAAAKDKDTLRLRRILYERQPFPDNYVDDSFLNELQKNVNIRTYRVAEAIIETGIVTQEICSLVLFTVTFAFLDDSRLQPQTLLCFAILGAITLYILKKAFGTIVDGDHDDDDKRNWCSDAVVVPRSVADDMKLAAIYVILNFAFAPALKTLTETTSSDTVYAMATAAFLVHLITHDYGPSFALVSAPLSFNAAIFGVVCLASRLPDSMSVFALLTTSVVMFALVPYIRRQLYQRCSRFKKGAITASSVCIVTAVLCLVSTVASVCFVFAVGFINVLCPIWFVRMQKYKENVFGPWDEAILNFS